MEIRKAVPKDINKILHVYQTARQYMRAHGNGDQWGAYYPPSDVVEEDIQKKRLFVVTEDEVIHGVFMFSLEQEPAYSYMEDGNWEYQGEYGVIHRVASDGGIKGMLDLCLDHCRQQTGHLRIDTHKNNDTMQYLLERYGFERRGIVYMRDGSPRIGFEFNWD